MLIILFGPICLLIVLLRPIAFIRFGIFQSTRIGGLSGQAYIYQCLKKENKHSKIKFFDILSYEKEGVCNKQLANMVSRQVKIFPFPKLIQLIIYSLKFWLKNQYIWNNKFFKEYEKGVRPHVIRFSGQPTESDYYLTNNQIFNFTQNEKNKAIDMVYNMGIKKNDKWVCIHNRDSKYLNTAYPDIADWTVHDYRNYDIDSMISTCEYYLSNNYHVIRMGKNAKNAIKFKHPRLIDFPFSDFQNDLLEIYLLSNCSFFIGSTSGISMIPFIFKKPVLFTNQAPIDILSGLKHNHFLCILKLWFDSNSNKILSLNEIFSRNLDYFSDTKLFSASKIKLIENTSDEILQASIELKKRKDNSWDESDENKELQKHFWNIVEKYKDKNISKEHNLFISSYFLKKHKDSLFE